MPQVTFSEQVVGPAQLRRGPTAIALVGIAPKAQSGPGAEDALVECKNAADDAQFGKMLDGYTIPQALKAIRAQHNSAKVVVVNVMRTTHIVNGPVDTFTTVSITIAGGTGQLESPPGTNKYPVDPTAVAIAGHTYGVDYTVDANGVITSLGGLADGAHNTDWTSWKIHTVANMKVTLDYAPDPSVTVVVKSSDGTTTYTLTTDYTIDDWGVISIVQGGSITEGALISVEYKRLDASLVSSADIIGQISPGQNQGIKKIGEDAMAELGYQPNILCIPTFNETSGVWQEMESYADTYKAVYLLDGETGRTPAQIVTDRGPLSTKSFNTANPRAICCYPKLNMVHGNGGSDFLFGFSAFMAGILTYKDATEGNHYGPNNHPIKGFSTVERTISWAPDATKDSGTLNAQGVNTVKMAGPGGVVVWGHYNASHPSVTDGTQFIPPRRVYDETIVTLQNAGVKWLGKPLNQGLADTIVAECNNYINGRIQDGALVVGSKCSWDPAKNTTANWAAGQLTIDVTYRSPSPLDVLDIDFQINLTL